MESIDKPLSEYNHTYKAKIVEKSTEKIEGLIENLEIDVEGNKRTVDEYYKKCEKSKKLKTKISAIKFFAWFFIIATVALGAFAYFKQEYMVYAIIGAVVTLALAILLFVYSSKQGKIKAKLDHEIAQLKSQAIAQVAPLKEAMNHNIAIDVVNETFSNVKFDYTFDLLKHEYFSQTFGLTKRFPDNKTILGIHSGSIEGNPFIIYKTRAQNMKNVTYHGELLIEWETVEQDNNGDINVVRHSQTLHASSVHPAPCFTDHGYVCFGCDEVEELSFSRGPAGVSELSDKKIDKFVKKKIKELEKMAEKSFKGDHQLILMNNEKFEALFGAIDRNDETKFRMLFTPLAQQNMCDSILDKDHLGDEFAMNKNGKITLVDSLYTAGLPYVLGNAHYYSFDLAKMKDQFVKFMSEFFEKIYFSLTPILNIPAYQEIGSYEKLEKFNKENTRDELLYPSQFEVEAEANRKPEYEAENSKTLSILKVKNLGGGLYDVDAYGFDTENMVDLISVRGDDGYYHDVPVRWIKYNKVSSTKTFTVE